MRRGTEDADPITVQIQNNLVAPQGHVKPLREIKAIEPWHENHDLFAFRAYDWLELHHLCKTSEAAIRGIALTYPNKQSVVEGLAEHELKVVQKRTRDMELVADITFKGIMKSKAEFWVKETILMAKSEPPARPEAGIEEPLQDSEAHVRDDNKQDEGASEDKHASEQEDRGEEAQVPEAFYLQAKNLPVAEHPAVNAARNLSALNTTAASDQPSPTSQNIPEFKNAAAGGSENSALEEAPSQLTSSMVSPVP